MVSSLSSFGGYSNGAGNVNLWEREAVKRVQTFMAQKGESLLKLEEAEAILVVDHLNREQKPLAELGVKTFEQFEELIEALGEHRTRLTHLDLKNVEIIGWYLLKLVCRVVSLKALEYLRVPGFSSTPVGIDSRSRFDQLNSDIEAFENQGGLKERLESLHTLVLFGDANWNAPFFIRQFYPQLPNVRKLKFECDIYPKDAPTMEVIQCFRGLEELNLKGHNAYEPGSLSTLAETGHLSKLRVLNLSKRSRRYLTSFHHGITGLSNLKELKLINSWWKDKDQIKSLTPILKKVDRLILNIRMYSEICRCCPDLEKLYERVILKCNIPKSLYCKKQPLTALMEELNPRLKERLC